jgi:hypothetical protein
VTESTPDLPADLEAFLADDSTDLSEAGLAYRELYVEEQVLGTTTSRFVKEGGVRFAAVKSYVITAANLEEMAIQQRGLPQAQLELLKFWFMIDGLRANMSYTSVSIRITLQPPGPAFLLEPSLEMTQADLEKTFSTEFAPEITRLLQLHLSRSRSHTIRRTESQPVVTAVNHGGEGFGWTFQARDGAPLFPRAVTTMAMVELPRGTSSLSGLFDSEALITRRILAKLIERPAAPVNAAVPFVVDLNAKPLSG